MSTPQASRLAGSILPPAFEARQRAAGKLSAVSFGQVPVIPRRALWDGYVYFGAVSMFAGKGSSGKGMLWAAGTARAVLGLPYPGDDPAARYTPVSAVWCSGPTEDDAYADMAPRLRAAIRAAVAEFGLDPELAGEGPRGAIHLVHSLNQWAGNVPVTYPADTGRVRAEVARIDAESAAAGRPAVGLVVADSVRSLLSDGHTINSGQGATRVMLAMSDFARGDAASGRNPLAVVYLHHLNAGGRVAGSEAVLDSLRFVFVVEQDRDDRAVRTITRRKANSVETEPQRYRITGQGDDGHAVFEMDADPHAARLEGAIAAGTPGGAPMRAALPPVPSAALPASPAASPRDTEGAPFRVVRTQRAFGADVAEAGQWIGGTYATRPDAYRAAGEHAGRVLTWRAVGERPGTDAAAFALDGHAVAYGVVPDRQPARPARVPSGPAGSGNSL